MQCDRKRLQYHAVVFCQAFSPCGTVLVTGDNFGRLGLFALKELLEQSSSTSASASDEYSTTTTITVCDGSIYALHTIADYLICGTTHGIKAYLWTSLIAAAESSAIGEPQEVWSLDPPSDIGGGRIVNGLCSMGKCLVSASATGCVQLWDVDSERLVRKFDGHSKQALCATSRPDAAEQCFSGSDDGTVKLWDSRSSSCCHTIMPNSSAMQTAKGANWVSAVAVDPNDRWLVCGGSMPMSLHHIAMLQSDATMTSAATTASSALPPSSSSSTMTSPQSTACQQAVTYSTVSPLGVGTTNACLFAGSSLLSAGSTSRLYHWDLGGSCQKEVPCSSKILYSVAACGEERDRVVSVAGSSAFLDVFTGYMYGAIKLSVG